MVSEMKETCQFEGKPGSKQRESGANTGADTINMSYVRVSSNEDETRESETDSGISGSERSDLAGARVCSDSDLESRDLKVKNEISEENRLVADKNDPIGAKEEEIDRNDERNERFCEGQGEVLSRDRSFLDEFDEYAASERNERKSFGLSRDLSYVFEVGDMVWGRVKSHPWWPGHIFNEAFASSGVRRTRREGHVLVAFFGDSSYGWFEPAELIPFDENFAEKSRQTNSRTFQKAVGEAVDEASRRRGLGLVCKCRNSSNFRLTYVPGYFTVDVPEYEPGGVYSIKQIGKARSNFQPNETLAFVKHLAAGPLNGDPFTISFVQNKATLHAYRRAVFEQHDETYSEAFGVQMQRSLTHVTEIDQPVKLPPKAPLSGPLVIAETLGGGKSSAMSMKITDHSKKDKYLFKRRDGPNNSGVAVSMASESSRGKPNIPIPLAYVEESSEATGMYLIQKRSSAVSAPHQPQVVEYEQKETVNVNAVPSVANVSGNDRVPNSSSLVNQDVAVDLKPPNGQEKELLPSMPQCLGEEDAVSTRIVGSMPGPIEERAPSAIYDISHPSQFNIEIPGNIKPAESTKLSRPLETVHQPDHECLTNVGEDLHKHNVKGGHTLMSVDKKIADASGIKKVKPHKRRLGDSAADSSVIVRKKKKMVSNAQTNSDPPSKQIVSGKDGPTEKRSKKSGPVILGDREEIQVTPQLVNAVGHDSLMNVKENVDLLQVLNDLHALALDPSYGFEENITDNVSLLILRFRSLVYQKSSVCSPPLENQSSAVGVAKYQTGVAVPRSGENVRPSPHVKQVKNVVRLDDPTKSGRKRPLSDRQVDIVARKQKKINDIRILAKDKNVASHKVLESGRESKDLMSSAQKFAKLNLIKRVETPPKMDEPTMLVIKCPPQTSLPSLAELKARFARFGPLDQSGIRVFWKTSTCRVVFLRKPDAEAAYKYTAANSTLFGGARVRCFLRGLSDPTNEVSEAGKLQVDQNTVEISKLKDPLVFQQQTSVLAQRSLGQPSIHLKSCLKKPSIDETNHIFGNGGGGSKWTPRVKFMLGGEESSRREQLTFGDRDGDNSTNLLDAGTSSVALDYNSKNNQNIVSRAQMSVPPIPPPFAICPQNNLHNSVTAPRNTVNFIKPTTSSATTATTVDVSQQMLILLSRCNDVVINLKGLLGYAPYHPL